jgi:hypothetical protein
MLTLKNKPEQSRYTSKLLAFYTLGLEQKMASQGTSYAY